MTRRVITARDQVALLAPWRREAAVTPDIFQGLKDEFDAWASDNHKTNPDDASWHRRPRGPIGYWPNLEDFMKERYPDSHQGLVTSEFPDEKSKQVAASMFVLHVGEHPGENNYLVTDPHQQNRMIDLGRKRMQMQRSYEQRQTTAAVNQDLVDRLRGEFHGWQRNARLAAVSDDVVNRLRQEFSDWYDQTGHADDGGLGGLDDRKWAQEEYGFQDRGPLSHWPNIENFLKDRYPAAHRGLEAGRERVDPLLDGDQNGHKSYQTGPSAVSEYGYDPRGVASAFMLMHLNAHGTCDKYWPGITDRAQQRLTDIFDKRQQMQRAYEQRQTTARHWMS